MRMSTLSTPFARGLILVFLRNVSILLLVMTKNIPRGLYHKDLLLAKRLLILDEDGRRREPEDFLRRHEAIGRRLKVGFVEEFESGELHRLRLDDLFIRVHF